MNTLTDEYLQGLIDSEPDYQEPAPAIDGASQAAMKDADWHLRNLARIEKRMTEVADLYRDSLDRLNAWHERQTKRLQKQAIWHTLPLEGLHRSILEADKDRKTIELPNGVLKSRTYTKPTLSIEDAVAVMEWMLTNHSDALKPKPPGVQLIDGFVRIAGPYADEGFAVFDKDTGELVPGVSAAIPAPTFDQSTDLDSEPF